MKITNKLLSLLLSAIMILSLFGFSAFAQDLCDVNGDGKISIVDAKWVLQQVAQLRTLDEAQTKAADLNRDGRITVSDAKGVLRAIAGGGDEESPSQKAEDILKLVNEERKKRGIAGLSLSEELNELANLKAKDMVQNNYFDHTSPTYGSLSDMMDEFGISFSTAGENIASGQASPQDVMKGWMNSDGHRANILNPSFTKLGVGYCDGGIYGTIWVQMFVG